MIDYEKKYKEALERARSMYESKDDAELASFIFPELRESEDERIRMALCDIVRDMPYMETELRAHGLTAEQVLAWLEKQKEQKPEIDINGLRKNLYQSGYNDGYKHGKEDNQKPAEWEDVKDTVDIPYCSSEPEWSEKDNIGWDEAFACVTRAEKAAKNEEELQNAVTAEKWLKEIKFKCYVHPIKQEWSEEDENALKYIHELISFGYSEKFMDAQTACDMRAWVNKSLRPQKDCDGCSKHLEGYISGRTDAEKKLLEQFGAIITPEHELHMKPRWKPSEEHLSALLAVFNDPNNIGSETCQLALTDLYEQLKSL